jgi:hypothetical protein
MGKENYCGVFYSNVWVFGHKLHLAPGQVLRQAMDAVNNSLQTVSNVGVVRLVASEQMSGQITDESMTIANTESSKEEISIGAFSGLVISSLTLVLGIGVLAMYFRADRNYQRISRKGKTASRSGVVVSDDDLTPTVKSFGSKSLGSFRFFSRNGTHKDERDGDDDAASDISSVVVDPKRGTYRKMECDKKVTITFDPSCRGSGRSSTCSDDISSVPPDYLDADGRYAGF